MTWDEFVAGWAGAHSGYDLRYAAAPRRRLLGFAYRASALLARFGIRPASMLVLAAGFACAVPLIAVREGSWPIIAAVFLLAGLGADTLGHGLAVVTGVASRLTRLHQALVERIGEVCWLLALAFLGTHLWLIFALGTVIWAHEYVKAKVGAPALRPVATATVGDRPTRIWATLTALALSAVCAQIGQDLAAGAVTLVAVSWLALALVGFGQLMGVIRRVLA